MQGIYYLLSIVAVLIVFIWYMRNDGLAEGEPTRGLLAMKEPAPPNGTEQLTKGDKKVGSSSASAGNAAGKKKSNAKPFVPRAHGR